MLNWLYRLRAILLKAHPVLAKHNCWFSADAGISVACLDLFLFLVWIDRLEFLKGIIVWFHTISVAIKTCFLCLFGGSTLVRTKLNMITNSSYFDNLTDYIVIRSVNMAFEIKKNGHRACILWIVFYIFTYKRLKAWKTEMILIYTSWFY